MNNNILSLIRAKHKSVDDIMRIVADNVKEMRLRRNITQQDFASKIGIALPTYRRFERTGEISLRRLIEISQFLDTANDFKKLFTKREYSCIEEVISPRPTRKRATRSR